MLLPFLFGSISDRMSAGNPFPEHITAAMGVLWPGWVPGVGVPAPATCVHTTSNPSMAAISSNEVNAPACMPKPMCYKLQGQTKIGSNFLMFCNPPARLWGGVAAQAQPVAPMDASQAHTGNLYTFTPLDCTIPPIVSGISICDNNLGACRSH